jgi:hypothetical protein
MFNIQHKANLFLARLLRALNLKNIQVKPTTITTTLTLVTLIRQLGLSTNASKNLASLIITQVMIIAAKENQQCRLGAKAKSISTSSPTTVVINILNRKCITSLAQAAIISKSAMF